MTEIRVGSTTILAVISEVRKKWQNNSQRREGKDYMFRESESEKDRERRERERREGGEREREREGGGRGGGRETYKQIYMKKEEGG